MSGDVVISLKDFTVCTNCLGTGKLKLMQSEISLSGKSTRYKDSQCKCRHCNGTGLRRGKI